MITKLPRWIEYGAFTLALIAGYINAIALLGFEHQAVSHLSGTATLFGIGFIDSNYDNLLHLFIILISFFLGSSFSGFLLHGSAIKLGRHYDTALTIEAGLLILAVYLLSKGSLYGHYLTSVACGLQNAFATTFSGAVVRTTHLTGIFTDLGIMVGRSLRGNELDKRKALLFLLIIIGFIVGASLAAYAFHSLLFSSLMIPAFMCLLLAIIYRIYRFKQMGVMKS